MICCSPQLQQAYSLHSRFPPLLVFPHMLERLPLTLVPAVAAWLQGAPPDAAEPPSWVLTISGRLLGKDKATDKAGGLGGLEGGEPGPAGHGQAGCGSRVSQAGQAGRGGAPGGLERSAGTPWLRRLALLSAFRRS